MKKFLTAKNGLYLASGMSIAAGVAGIVLNMKCCDSVEAPAEDEVVPNDPFADAVTSADQT